MIAPSDTVVALPTRSCADGSWWVYVIDHDRKRFAVGTAPVNSSSLWQRRVNDARIARNRNLECGVVSVSEASTIAAAAAAVKAMAKGLEQYDPRVIFAATQPPPSAARRGQPWAVN